MLTPKQKKFVEAYMGNAAKAALEAGYSAKTATVIAYKLMKIPEIAKAIAARTVKKENKLIATREERQEFLTRTMLDADLSMKDRLKASQLLGHSQADFTDKIEATGKAGGPLVFVWGGDKESDG